MSNSLAGSVGQLPMPYFPSALLKASDSFVEHFPSALASLIGSGTFALDDSALRRHWANFAAAPSAAASQSWAAVGGAA